MSQSTKRQEQSERLRPLTAMVDEDIPELTGPKELAPECPEVARESALGLPVPTRPHGAHDPAPWKNRGRHTGKVT